MMNKNNTYFENLYKLGCEWEAAREERRARKQTIIDTYGWDSEELKAGSGLPLRTGNQQGLQSLEDQPPAQGRRGRDERLPLGARGRGLHRSLPPGRDQDLRLYQPEHSSDGKPAPVRSSRLQDGRPLHHHKTGRPLGRGRALRGHGNPLFLKLSTNLFHQNHGAFGLCWSLYRRII